MDGFFGAGASPMLVPSGRTVGLQVDTMLSVISSLKVPETVSGEDRSCSTSGELGNQDAATQTASSNSHSKHSN